MPELDVWTARLGYVDDDLLDVTRKSAGPDGLPFAPSWSILTPRLALRRAGRGDRAALARYYDEWPAYVAAYTAELRVSYRTQWPAWQRLLDRGRVVLACYCTDARHCHRTVLAGVLAKLGAHVHGEVDA